MPLTHTYFAFPIDRQMYLVFKGELHEHWREAAKKHGFTLLGRAVDRLHVVLECKTRQRNAQTHQCRARPQP